MGRRRDVWGYDANTGARGLSIGVRRVKNGMVKIGGEYWKPRYGSLDEYEGKDVEVACQNAWATEYAARGLNSSRSVDLVVSK